MIAVVFDELDVVARKLGTARAALPARDVAIPTDAGVLGSDVVAGAAAAFTRAMARRRQSADETWERLRTGVGGAAHDFRAFEDSAVDALREMEAAL